MKSRTRNILIVVGGLFAFFVLSISRTLEQESGGISAFGAIARIVLIPLVILAVMAAFKGMFRKDAPLDGDGSGETPRPIQLGDRSGAADSETRPDQTPMAPTVANTPNGATPPPATEADIQPNSPSGGDLVWQRGIVAILALCLLGVLAAALYPSYRLGEATIGRAWLFASTKTNTGLRIAIYNAMPMTSDQRGADFSCRTYIADRDVKTSSIEVLAADSTVRSAATYLKSCESLLRDGFQHGIDPSVVRKHHRECLKDGEVNLDRFARCSEAWANARRETTVDYKRMGIEIGLVLLVSSLLVALLFGMRGNTSAPRS